MGTGSSASDAATAANGQTQQQINSTVGAIQKAYGSPARQQQYTQYGNSLKDYYTNQVNTQQTVNARDLTFALARSGLTGGSAATDANGQLQKDYTNGLLSASQQAQGGEAALENADVNSKNQLIGLAEQGDTTGNIGGDIASAQAASLGAAGNYGNANALGNLFAGTSSIYNQEQTAAANRKAQASPIGSLYGGTTNSSSAFT
jgi:hypothetical protein